MGHKTGDKRYFLTIYTFFTPVFLLLQTLLVNLHLKQPCLDSRARQSPKPAAGDKSFN